MPACKVQLHESKDAVLERVGTCTAEGAAVSVPWPEQSALNEGPQPLPPRRIERHGLEADQRTTPCEAQTLSELHSLQRKMFPLRLSNLDEVYHPRNENRRLRKSTLTEFEAVWAAELALVKEWPGVESTLRDGRCHEVVMWWAHHLGPGEQEELLKSGAVLPLLPVVEHFRDASDHDALAEAGELSEVDSHVIQTVRSTYKIQVGCAACHISSNPISVANGTTCPADRRDSCMGHHRLNCNAAQLGRQCCSGSVCKEVFLPASDMALSSYATQCVPGTAANDESILGSINANVSPEVVSDRPLPPILPSSYRTNGTYFNETADYPTEPAGTENMLFNQYGLGGMATIRVDFAPLPIFTVA